MNRWFLTWMTAVMLIGTLMNDAYAASAGVRGLTDGERKINQPVKVACVGNSVTYGFGIEERDSWHRRFTAI